MLQKIKSNAACRPALAPVTCMIKQHMALFRLPYSAHYGIKWRRSTSVFCLLLQTFQPQCGENQHLLLWDWSLIVTTLSRAFLCTFTTVFIATFSFPWAVYLKHHAWHTRRQHLLILRFKSPTDPNNALKRTRDRNGFANIFDWTEMSSLFATRFSTFCSAWQHRRDWHWHHEKDCWHYWHIDVWDPPTVTHTQYLEGTESEAVLFMDGRGSCTRTCLHYIL